MKPLYFIGIALLALSLLPLDATVSMPSIFQDSMVLQRNQPIPVFGNAASGESVTVTFGSQVKNTTAAGDGSWRVDLDPEAASATGRTLSVQGTNTLNFSDVLVGEVWICSGQSNMARSLSNSDSTEASAFLAEANAGSLTQIRIFNQNTVNAASPASDVTNGQWHVVNAANNNAVNSYSAVALYYGRKLHQDLNVPVGLLNASWGGKSIERFISAGASDRDPHVKLMADADSASSQIYNGMVYPLAPFGVKGAIWLQGENNVSFAWIYYKQLPTMIADWRALWGQDRFHFGIIQLHKWNDDPVADASAIEKNSDLRQVQDYVHQSVADTFFASYIDASWNAADPIHTLDKRPVGERLALRAQEDVYASGSQPDHPRYLNHSVAGSQVTINFANGSGLSTTDAADPKFFMLAGADRIWHAADSVSISGSSIIASSGSVSTPVAVSYAHFNEAGVNLVNGDGMPALSFATDTWSPSTGWTPQRKEGATQAVVLIHPVHSQEFEEGSTILLSADATIDLNASGKEMQKVEFYNGAVKIGDATGSPAIYTWTNVPAGNYNIVAKSKDTDDVEASSEIVPITVVSTGGPANQAPVATISEPTSSVVITEGDNLNFSGSGSDTEDGDVSSTASWVSSLDGLLSNLPNFSTSTLSVGVHTVTLTVTDSGTLQGQAQVTVTVNSASGSGPAGVLIESDFTGVNPANNLPWTSTSALASGVSFSGWQAGAGALSDTHYDVADAVDNAIGVVIAAGSVRSTLSEAIAEDEYLTMTLTPSSPLNLNGATISFTGTLGNRASNPHKWAIMTSVGGFTDGAEVYTANFQFTSGFGGTPQDFSFTLPSSGYDNLSTPVEIRIYLYDAQWNGNFEASQLNAFKIEAVGVSGSAYDSWASTHGLSGSDALGTADPDGDGVANLLEYALSGLPADASSRPLPVLAVSGSTLEIRFERIADPDLTYEVEATSNLQDWGSSPIWSSTGAQNTAGSVTVPDSAPLSGSRYLRLKVVQ